MTNEGQTLYDEAYDRLVIFLIKIRRSKWQRSIRNAELELEQAVEVVDKLDELGL